MSDEVVQAHTKEHLLLRPFPALLLCIALSFIYNWYYLGSGFYGDEYCFLNMLREDPLRFARWAGFWSIYDVPGLTGAWWFEQEAMGTFWRPLPALIFEGSIRLFGERALPLHLFSVFVHGLVGGTLFLLLRRMTGKPFVALVAAIIYLSCEDHSMSVGWISTFTDLICVLFINLSFLAHLHWLQKRKPLSLVITLLLLVPAFLSKESAVLAPLGILLMTLLLPGGRDAAVEGFNRSSVKRDLRRFFRDWISWVPALTMMVSYLTLYKLLGFGGMNNAMYVDPLVDPGRYLSHLVLHLPVMWLATMSPVPPSLSWFLPASLVYLSMAGVVSLVILVAALWSERKRGLVLWGFSFYLLSLLPQMSSDASERGLYLPAIASSMLLALILVKIGPLARRLGELGLESSRFTRLVGWTVLLGVLLPGAILSSIMPFSFVRDFESMGERVGMISPIVEQMSPDRVIVLNTPGPFYFFYPPEIVRFQTGRDVDVRVLSAVRSTTTVEPLDDRSFIMRVDGSGWLTNPFTGMVRLPETPQQGRVYESGLFSATLLEMTPLGDDVAAVRFDMERPLNDSGTLFVIWDGTTFRHFEPSELPVGTPFSLVEGSVGFPF